MRLLHTEKYTFKEYFDPRTAPPYAMLSHRWTDEEVSHKQFIDNSYQEGPGIDKIRHACAEARRLEKLDWLWVDTICIDKSSSAELTEAINSMYQWYGESYVCLAYLADVDAYQGTKEASAKFAASDWFKRGWTLQELIAPIEVRFYDASWRFIGTKETMSGLVSNVTGIQPESLLLKISLSQASVAMKMSWASKRTTTRKEDMAYCLLGLFEVNMPLLYGEGRNAFFRLQLEILKNFDDESIYAWKSKETKWQFADLRGMLADSPAEFAEAGDIQKMALGPELRLPWAWTNKGLELRILDRADKNSFDPMPPGRLEQVVHLGCYLPATPPGERADASSARNTDQYIAITLRRFANAWYRIYSDTFILATGFESISRFQKAPLVYRYYYVPRRPNKAAYDDFVEWLKTRPDVVSGLVRDVGIRRS